MSGISFLSENYTDSGVFSLLSGTENAQFPLENLRNDSPGVKFRSVGSTSVILIDLQTTRNINYLAVAADPLDSFLVSSVKIKTSTTTDFSLSTEHNIPLSVEQAIGYMAVTAVSHRYVRVELTGSGGFSEIGKIFVGEAINLPLNSFSISSFQYSVKDASAIQKNEYGQRFINNLNQIKELSGTIQYCTKAEQETLDDMLIRHGKRYPLWIILDEASEAMNSGNFKLSMYGYLDKDPQWKADGGQLYTVDIEMSQAI
jgi:hypothetical protein